MLEITKDSPTGKDASYNTKQINTKGFNNIKELFDSYRK